MSKIEWTDVAIAPVKGCTPISPGCRFCYSARLDGARLKNLPVGDGRCMGDLVKIKTGKDGRKNYVYSGDVFLDPATLAKALQIPSPRKGRRMVFWNHRSDTFHESLSNEQIAPQFGVMAARPDLTFIVLTKRARRMREWFALHIDHATECGERASMVLGEGGFTSLSYGAGGRWPLPNVWLGVSAEGQRYADERIPELLQTPAAKRFVSLEPLLGQIDLRMIRDGSWHDREGANMYDALDGNAYWSNGDTGVGGGPKLDWVIAGAESGPGARPADLDWFRSIRDQCVAAGVPYFLKQADVCETCSGTGRESHVQVCRTCLSLARAGKVRKGCPALDGRVWDQVPEVK